MKNHKHSAKYILVAFLVMMLVGSAYRHRSNKLFYQVVNNKPLISAMQNANTDEVNKQASAANIYVSEYKNYQLISQSKSDLPKVSLMPVIQNITDGVIVSSINDYVKTTRPYLKWFHGHMWLIVSFFEPDSKGDGYILYKRYL